MVSENRLLRDKMVVMPGHGSIQQPSLSAGQCAGRLQRDWLSSMKSKPKHKIPPPTAIFMLRRHLRLPTDRRIYITTNGGVTKFSLDAAELLAGGD